MTRLVEIAHARAGDKGDTSIIVVAPYEERDYERVHRNLRVSDLARHFGVAEGNVSVHPIESLRAFTIVIRERLDGGVTRSRAADPHGKTLSGHLLELQIRD